MLIIPKHTKYCSCRPFLLQLEKAHRQRAELVKSCIVSVSGAVSDLKTRHQGDADNVPLLQKLRKEQWTVRHLVQPLVLTQGTAFRIQRSRRRYEYRSDLHDRSSVYLLNNNRFVWNRGVVLGYKKHVLSGTLSAYYYYSCLNDWHI